MLENFHATIKMITGEEVLAQVMPAEEHDKLFFILSNPIVVHENVQIDQEKGVAVSGLIPKKWMTFASDDMTIVNKDHIVSISELDSFGVDFYNKALVAARMSTPVKKKVDADKNSGFVGKIQSFREKLEGVFDDSPDLPTSN